MKVVNLQEQYEDALLALLMDKRAELEGQRLLDEAERLRKNPDFTIPLDPHERCGRTISEHDTKKHSLRDEKKLIQLLSRISIISLTAGITLIAVSAL